MTPTNLDPPVMPFEKSSSNNKVYFSKHFSPLEEAVRGKKNHISPFKENIAPESYRIQPIVSLDHSSKTALYLSPTA